MIKCRGRRSMESVSRKRIRKEEVIAKLKDDGDFDNLRLQIIRKLKNNEELRNNIVAVVKQSETLNRPDSESMKPRQLSDAIFEEVGGEVMRQISDGLWEIIRSGDGMKNEIADTVQSVYNRLLNPGKKGEGESSTHNEWQVQKQSNCNGLPAPSVCRKDNILSAKQRATPDVSVASDKQKTHEAPHKEDTPLSGPHVGHSTEQEKSTCSQNVSAAEDGDLGAPPGFSVILEKKQPSDDDDEDPDLPPGFG